MQNDNVDIQDTPQSDQPAPPKKKRGGGPKTPEGKARSSRNAVVHGFTATQFTFLAHEEYAELDEIIDRYMQDFQPTSQIAIDLGLSIAWQNVPWQLGGWADDWSCDKKIPQTLLEAEPSGKRFFVAGDQVSYLSGWQEGAVRSAHHVIGRIANIPKVEADAVLMEIVEPEASIRKAPSTKRRTRGLP